MNFGIRRGIIVPKESAVLGYANEIATYLNANHRDVCKFSSEEDPNYLAVRNALASALSELRDMPALKRRDTDYEQQQWLSEMLNWDDTYVDEYQKVESLRIPGSCLWITEKSDFQQWRDAAGPSMYWVTAKPGTGKSVLSGFVINHLYDRGHACAHYFFTHGDKSKSGIGSFLRSMAWQMCQRQAEVFEFLVRTFRKEPQLAKADFRTIWRKLYTDGIFKLEVRQAQYWVIDALDECKSPDLVSFLLKAAETKAVKIFLTCRNPLESYGETIPRSLEMVSETISQRDTKSDISLYLSASVENIPLLGSNESEAREATQHLILEKSAGCFLWVRLVLQELRKVHTDTEVRQVLQDVPSDMDELYTRIVDNMSQETRGKRLAQAILTWAVSSARPLTVDELYYALQLDINDNIDSVQRSIASTCGQLVFVDGQSRIQMVHQTARDFLLRPNNPSEFAVGRRVGNTRLAMVCLQYLNSSEMSGLKPRKLSANLLLKEPSPFMAYACNSLWEHIAYISSDNDDFIAEMARFLTSSNVLTWIEYIAKRSELSCLIQTGRALRNFLQRRSKHHINLGKDIPVLDSWSVDLVRLVTKFGKKLLASPHSIFQLIPPFCPSESALRKQFASSNRAIRVSGLSATTWDDCVSTITHQHSTPSALAAGNGVFVVGMNDGQIKLYHEETCQYLRTVSHGEAVKLLKFGSRGNLLASAGRRHIRIWDSTEWQQIAEFQTDANCVALSFVDDDRLLLAALRNSRLWVWNLETSQGEELESWLDIFNGGSSGRFPHPTSIAFAEKSTQVAVAYRGHDIIIWDIEEGDVYDIYGQEVGSLGRQSRRRPGVSTITRLAYSRNPDANLLAAAANDGLLMVFNTEEGTIQASVPANAHTLVSSPDGLTLAVGNSGGVIQLFEFDSLKLLHSIYSEEFGIKDLTFTADSRRLIDIRGSHCRVWDPPVLVRQEVDENISDTISVSTAPQDYQVDDTKLGAQITALAFVESVNMVFCGKVDGSVHVYDGQTGAAAGLLFRHSMGTSIVSLLFELQSSVLISADSSSRIIAYTLTRNSGTWKTSTNLLDYRTGTAVDQVICNTGCTRILISSATRDELWAVEPTGCKSLVILTWPQRRQWRWCQRPKNPEELILIMDDRAHIYEWSSLSQISLQNGVKLEGFAFTDLAVCSVLPCFDNTVIAVTFNESTVSRSKSHLLFWNSSDFAPESHSAAPIPHFQPLVDKVECLIGVHGRRLVFLDRDGWVCSADDQHLDPDERVRHFFFPPDWLTAAQGLMLGIFENSNIVIVQRDEIAVIRRGLEHFEQGHSKGGISKRPSLARSSLSEPALEKHHVVPFR